MKTISFLSGGTRALSRQGIRWVGVLFSVTLSAFTAPPDWIARTQSRSSEIICSVLKRSKQIGLEIAPILQPGSNKNVSHMRRFRQSAHGRLKGGDETLFPLVFIPGLKRETDRENEVRQFRRLVHEIRKTDFEKGVPSEGLVRTTAWGQIEGRVGVVENQKIRRSVRKPGEEILYVGTLGDSLHPMPFRQAQSLEPGIKDKVQQIHRHVGLQWVHPDAAASCPENDGGCSP